MVVCRPPIPNDVRRLSGGSAALASDAALAAAAAGLDELAIRPPADVPTDAPDAALARDIDLGTTQLRLPLFYGHRGGASAEALCTREIAPLISRVLAGESAAIIAYGQVGAGGERGAAQSAGYSIRSP